MLMEKCFFKLQLKIISSAIYINKFSNIYGTFFINLFNIRAPPYRLNIVLIDKEDI